MGYVIESITEAEKIIRMVSFYASIGLCVAETEGQKQFILERIYLEMGLSPNDVRAKFGGKPGEWFDISEFVKAFEEKESKR